MNLRSIYVLGLLYVVLYNCWLLFPEPWDKEIIYKDGHTTINLYRNTVFDVCQGLTVLVSVLWPTFRRLSLIDVLAYVVHCSFLVVDIFDVATNGDYGSPAVELLAYVSLMLFVGFLKAVNGDCDRENWRVWLRRLRRRADID
jgi:hypothetical protein